MLKTYKNFNGVSDGRRAQTMAAKVVFAVAMVLAFMVACAPVAPAHAQASNATLPAYQRCDLMARVALSAVQARISGVPEQDIHIQLDQTDPLASRIIHSWYNEPSAMNSSPETAEGVTRAACQQHAY